MSRTELVDVGAAGGREIDRFDPSRTITVDAQLDAVIAFAKRMHEWDLLKKAIDEKLAEQQEFVWWWGRTVQDKTAGLPNVVVTDPLPRISVDEATEHTRIGKMQVSRWRKWLKTPELYRDRLFGVEWSAAMAKTNPHTSENSGDNEWYTPPDILDAARLAMGGIDLDPASSATANETVRAARYFDEDADGLEQEWSGRVWLNPPYAQPLCSQFCGKLLDELDQGNVEQACVLVNNATETEWFQSLGESSSAICFHKGRIRFKHSSEKESAPLQGQAIVYCGSRAAEFATAFASKGLVMRNG